MLRLKVTDLLFRCGRFRLNPDIRIKRSVQGSRLFIPQVPVIT